MSYDIIYNREFLRTTSGDVIPLVLGGSSNTYESLITSRGKPYQRRARSWTVLFGNTRILWTPEELMNTANACVPSAHNEHFVFRSKWVDDDGFIRFMKAGIKDAKTVEELKSLSRTPDQVRLHCFAEVRETTENNRHRISKEMFRYVNTSKELDEFFEDYAAYAAGKAENNASVRMVIEFPGDDAVPNRVPTKQKRNLFEECDEVFVLQNNNGWYFASLTKYSLRTTSRIRFARHFATEKDAKAYLEKKKHRMTARGSTWAVRKFKT